MALLPLLFVLVQSLIQYPQPAGDGLDEATQWQMKERQVLLDHEMARLLQELEQQDEGWGAVLFGALQEWPCWVLAGVLLLLGLWFSCRRRMCEPSSSSKDQSSCKTLGDERGKQREEDSAVSKEGGESTDVTLEADDSGSEMEGEGSAVATDGEDDDDAIESNDNMTVKEDSNVYNGNDLQLKATMMGMCQQIMLLKELQKNLAKLQEMQNNYRKDMNVKTKMYRWSKTRKLQGKRKKMEMKKKQWCEYEGGQQ